MHSADRVAVLVLKPRGKFFGMMIASDPSARSWPGVIHFFTLAEIRRLFKGFAHLHIESVIRTKNNRTVASKFWIVEAQK